MFCYVCAYQSFVSQSSILLSYQQTKFASRSVPGALHMQHSLVAPLSAMCYKRISTFPAGVDFDSSTVSVNFPAEAGDACVDVAIIDDVRALEGDERFVVEFDVDLLPTNANIGSLSGTTITIQDDDRKWHVLSPQ